MTPLLGYRRRDGRFGVRNHVLVLSTVTCANRVVQRIGFEFPEVACIDQAAGCMSLDDDREITHRMLLGLARNPNVGAVCFVGLGCEQTPGRLLRDEIGDLKPAESVAIQSCGSSDQAIERVRSFVVEASRTLAAQPREPFDAADLVIATKCGASDWTSALASNPAVGVVSDRVVCAGGISMMGESAGWFGADHVLLGRARDERVREDILRVLRRLYENAMHRGKRIDEANPSPGNMAGGLTTLTEKALGGVRKSGESPIEGILAPGETPLGRGLWLLDNPSLDPASVAGMAAAGAQLVLFTTGRGTPIGSPICPVIKICASAAGSKRLAAHIDVDITDIVESGASIGSGADRIESLMHAVASGERTRAEAMGHREFVMPQVGVL
ncbi:MAG: UxaA family hydrolase [Burkholderiaceae bacterium]|nr:UxaA family hydrolase [Burkholderiaceae bacterium]MCO5106780.1 UxaA family hydrolase [Burkholderiaceae bacterium]